MTHATEDLRKYNGELAKLKKEQESKDKQEAEEIEKDMTTDVLLDLSNQ